VTYGRSMVSAKAEKGNWHLASLIKYLKRRRVDNGPLFCHFDSKRLLVTSFRLC
jgi:hypothetical protein